MTPESGYQEKPVPDPTVLTTEQLLREVDRVKELLITMIDEKLHSVDIQFALIERMRVEQKADTNTSLQAALSAAKEAVKEQTIASDKSIQKSETSFQTAINGVVIILDDLKDRINRVETAKATSFENEGRQLASRQVKAGSEQIWLGIIGIVLTIVIAYATIHGIH